MKFLVNIFFLGLALHACYTNADCTNEASVEVDGEQVSCDTALVEIGAHRACTSEDYSEVSAACCAACSARQQTGRPGCEYGQDPKIKMVIDVGHPQPYTCDEIVDIFGKAQACNAFPIRCCDACA